MAVFHTTQGKQLAEPGGHHASGRACFYQLSHILNVKDLPGLLGKRASASVQYPA